eukprot:772009-Rhodomonas_salina.1
MSSTDRAYGATYGDAKASGGCVGGPDGRARVGQLLFGGEVTVLHERGEVRVDDWVSCDVTKLRRDQADRAVTCREL